MDYTFTVFRAFSRVQGGHIQGDSPRRYCCGYVQGFTVEGEGHHKSAVGSRRKGLCLWWG
ncbi:hypothetical protein ASPBRDRAFT_47861 [Aspergillus brasiliensis CBS 101740]|uniref:Uncharacterized protein n=1 Tax=Aspergillus brasiliensis (strain CBS 101740 / IMI 381727 / IBT 21946) TaxID=767769 RepID=A0A1L9U6Y5_ASPBC|nr:hypothetical protein ASPBRDRAFT_47861 [Aspergillus brasiliensis CBS 101740]